MAMTITLPDALTVQLQEKADADRLSAEEVALDILRDALAQEEDFLTPEEVVKRIQASAPLARSIRSANGSLAEALQNAPEDPHFDLDSWQKAWAEVEAEMKVRTQADTHAEGRG